MCRIIHTFKVCTASTYFSHSFNRSSFDTHIKHYPLVSSNCFELIRWRLEQNRVVCTWPPGTRESRSHAYCRVLSGDGKGHRLMLNADWDQVVGKVHGSCFMQGAIMWYERVLVSYIMPGDTKWQGSCFMLHLLCIMTTQIVFKHIVLTYYIYNVTKYK